LRRSLFWLLDHYPDTGESLASLHETALDHARLADRLGFRTLWIAEHHFQTLGTVPNPAVLLAAIARSTERLRLGPAVSVLPLRDPILVAEDYALVDVLSGGRLDMGVGTGSRPLEFAGMGLDFERRRDVFDAHLSALRERWRSALAGERGSAALNVAPLQSPPRLYVATLRAEGAHAIGLAGDSLLTLVSPATPSLADVAARLEAHARGLAEGGHAPGSADAVVVAFAHVAASDAEARRTVAPALGRLVGALAGAAPADAGDLYDAMRERDTGLFGGPESVTAQIERHAAAGVRHLAFVSRFGGMEAAAAERSLRRLAPPEAGAETVGPR